MSIQKLLPCNLPGGTYYSQSGQIATSMQNSQRDLSPDIINTIINYSGGEIYGKEAPYQGYSLDYIRKTLSVPDDSTYVGLGVAEGSVPNVSGQFIPGRTKVFFSFSMPLDVPSIAIDSITPRFRYSGLPLIDGDTYYKEDVISRFWIYNKNDNDGFPYSPVLLYNTPTFSYIGDPKSSFVDVSMPTTSLNGLISQEDLDNRFYSGDYLLFTLDFPVSGYVPSTFEASNITLDKNIAFSAFEFEASGRIPSKSINMHLYSAPIEASGDFALYSKRHGYIDSIEEVTVGGVQKLYPTSGTYANGSGALFSFNFTRDTTYRNAVGYNGVLSGVISPSYSGHNPMVDYISESTDSPNNISYIEIADSPSFNSGYLNHPTIRIGTQLDRLASVPTYLQTNIAYSGDYSQSLLNYSSTNFESHFFLTLESKTYEIGYIKDLSSQLSYNSESFNKISSSKLYFDGTPQPSPLTVLNISGDLLSNIINSGAIFSTYTIINDDGYLFYGYRKYRLSAFDIETSGTAITEYIAHPQLYMQGASPNSDNLDLSIPNVTIPVDSGLNLNIWGASSYVDAYVNPPFIISGDNQIVSGLSFAMPSPSFAIKDISMYTRGDYLTSLNMYIENGELKNTNNNFTLTTYNNYTSGEITKNINFHTSNQSGVEDNINMFIGGEGSFSGNTNLPMFIGSFNQSGVDNVSLFINNLLSSGNYGLDLYIANTITESGNINLYINGGGYGAENNNVNLYVENTPYNLESGISLFLPNNVGSISSPSGNSKPGNIDFYTYSTANSSGDMNLYIAGDRYGLSSSNINIYVNSDMPSGNIYLSIHNTLDYLTKDINFNLTSILDLSGDIAFSIDGGGIDLRQGELNLFTRSAITSSGSLDFSILGNTSRELINLSIKVNELLEIGSGVPLSIFSALDSGVFNSFTITTKARGYESSLPMYLPTSSTGSDNSNIYMVMLNDTRDNKDVFLYIENNVLDNSANYTLFTQGEGTLNGGSVYSSSMNLFINRGNESVYNTIPMTLAGPSGMFESVPLVMSGGYINESGITLTMPSTVGNSNKRMDLYVNGFLY